MYRAHDITQLFIAREMMTNVRWPNSLWSDYTIFGSQFWVKFATASTPKRKVDSGKLVESGLHITGAIAVLNIGSFCAFAREVLFHTKSNSPVMALSSSEIQG